MSFAFNHARGVAQQVRGLACKQVEKAIAGASDGASDFDATVHQLRRRCKKLRGLLRLVEPGFGGFEAENAALRAAANLLGGARDAHVMVETLDGLVGDEAGKVAPAYAVAARQHLVGRIEALSGGGERDGALAQFIAIFRDIAERAEEWRFDDTGFGVVGAGLEATYRRLCKRMAAAEREDTADALHEWRKQAKYHYFHVGLLSKAAPDLLGNRVRSLERLGDLLGDHHNLAVLDEVLSEQGDLLGDVAPIHASIAARQEELAGAAFVLGRQLVVEKPSALRRRFAGYWQLLPKEA